MVNVDVSCPKCKAEMEEGFVLDRGHYNTPNSATWVGGSLISPTTMEKLFGDPLRGKRQRSITSYRCTSCGYLEAYAK
jgi:predicted nucleic-acid-binding Zn-ribbon protein